MCNQKFQIVSEMFLNEDIGSGMLKGLKYGAMAAIPIGLLNALLKVGKDLPPADQQKLKNAVTQYIKQNNLDPVKNQPQIKQFTSDYAKKLGKMRFARRFAAGAGASLAGGAAIGGIHGAFSKSAGKVPGVKQPPPLPPNVSFSSTGEVLPATREQIRKITNAWTKGESDTFYELTRKAEELTDQGDVAGAKNLIRTAPPHIQAVLLGIGY